MTFDEARGGVTQIEQGDCVRRRERAQCGRILHAAERHERRVGTRAVHEQRVELRTEHGRAHLVHCEWRQRACALDVGQERCERARSKRCAGLRGLERSAQRRRVRQLCAPRCLRGRRWQKPRRVRVARDGVVGHQPLQRAIESFEPPERRIHVGRLHDEQIPRVRGAELLAQFAVALEQVARHRCEPAEVVLPERLAREQQRGHAHDERDWHGPARPRQPRDGVPHAAQKRRAAVVAPAFRHQQRHEKSCGEPRHREPSHGEACELREPRHAAEPEREVRHARACNAGRERGP